MKLVPAVQDEGTWELPSAGKVGMWALICAESAIFVIFIVAYAFYIGKSVSGPTPSILTPPILISICLIASSGTMELALMGLKRGKKQLFALGWIGSIVLGSIFLVGTGLEWVHLMRDEGLYVATNLFGTTFYSLVGLHGLHVTIGLLLMLSVAVFLAFGKVGQEHEGKLAVIGLYWHFVDTVWVVVFTLVYVVGR